MPGDKPHYHGHRERLRTKLLKQPESLADYEVLEFLLFAARPQGDTKPLAKSLITRFGSLAAVLTADPEALEAAGLKKPTIGAFKIVPEAAIRLAREELSQAPVFSSADSVIAYCRIAIGHASAERFHLLYLDRKNRLIADETQQKGTVDHAPVYPREVVKRALELGATALVLVHNHPSGDPTPSQADIAMTREIKEAAGKLGITLHDHLVIAAGGHSSFRSLGLI